MIFPPTLRLGSRDQRLLSTEGTTMTCRSALLLAIPSALLVAAQLPQSSSQGVQETAQTVAVRPLDVPLQLIHNARLGYDRLNDYTCLFVKRERLRGQLQAENLISMAVRTKPFSVYLRWVKPESVAGQEACYVTGRNNGMMRVHSTGVLGVVGFVSLEPRDPRALENSRHTILESGIGNIVEKFAKRWTQEAQWNRTVVRSGEYEYNKRRCIRVETIHPANPGGTFTFYRSLVYFDKENHLPIRVDNYGWPKQGGDPNGDLEESYSFANLRLNVGVPEQTFNK
jgi:hypothetical protein